MVVVIGIMAIAGLFLLSYKKSFQRSAAGLAVSVLGAGGTGYVLKMIVERGRPSDSISALTETSFSYPSVHATFSVALYGFLAYVLCKRYPHHAPMIVTFATILILAIGFSRLYLGVHFPSDVLAGYLLGGLWLLVGIGVVNARLRNSLGQV